jgi:hypothetical protein
LLVKLFELFERVLGDGEIHWLGSGIIC